MRAWVVNRIKAMTTLPAGFKDRVLAPGAVENPLKPFTLINMNSEQPVFGLPAEARAQSVPFTVWLHDEPGSMVDIDNASIIIKDALPAKIEEEGFKIGNLSVYEVRWTGTGDDGYDDHFGTTCRPVRFVAMTRR